LFQAAYPSNFTGIITLLLFGLAPKRVYNAIIVTNYAVSSYPTFSPLPISRRYIFCCTIPKLTLARYYLVLFSSGARTFLLIAQAIIAPSKLTIFENN